MKVVIRVELGRLPIECFIKTQTLLYLARLYNNNLNPLIKEAFSLAQSLDLTGTYSLNEEEKILCLLCLLNPSSPLQTNKLGSFLKKSLELRAGDS